jgi:hypothetical protein
VTTKMLSAGRLMHATSVARRVQHGFLLAIMSVFLFGLPVAANPVGSPLDARPPDPFIYVSPMPGAIDVSAGTTVAVRQGRGITRDSVLASLFHVRGSRSGAHSGRAVLARDGMTVIFVPHQPFIPSEQVAVTLDPGLNLVEGGELSGISFEFTISPKPYPYAPASLSSVSEIASSETSDLQSSEAANSGAAAIAGSSTEQQIYKMPRYVTVPDLQPGVVITKTNPNLGQGYFFLTPFDFALRSSIPYSNTGLLIVDDSANLVFYQKTGGWAFDFKRQPDGTLSVYDDGAFRVMDSSYNTIDTWSAGNGYPTDPHDLQLLPNGHALLMIYDLQPTDLSPYGGRSDATLVDLIVQELDQDHNVVFQWRGRDHIAISDTYESLTTALVDYIHGNAIELDSDDNLLISSRHLSEITKIDRQTGDIIWRLGGKNNQFVFSNDTPLPDLGIYFSYQHDIRRLPNGHITLFDNANQFDVVGQRHSRAAEYALDETAMIATLVRAYVVSPAIQSDFMGNQQRLPNDNRVVGWGGSARGLDTGWTEFTPDGAVALQGDLVAQNLEANTFSYRAFRFPWQGYPTWAPALVALSEPTPGALYYSWNGATEVASYDVFGGRLPDDITGLVSQQARTAFEDTTSLENTARDTCFFRVRPIDKQQVPQLFSNIAYRGDASCGTGLTADGVTATQKIFAPTYNTGDVTVALSVPAGPGYSPIPTSAPATTSETIFVWSRGNTTAMPPEMWTGVGFGIDAFDSVALAKKPVFANPVEVEIDYAPQDLFSGGKSPALRIWDSVADEWIDAGATLVQNDLVNRRVTFAIAKSGDYAVLGTPGATKLYLPLITRFW